jgi:hypothetical protein
MAGVAIEVATANKADFKTGLDMGILEFLHIEFHHQLQIGNPVSI